MTVAGASLYVADPGVVHGGNTTTGVASTAASAPNVTAASGVAAGVTGCPHATRATQIVTRPSTVETHAMPGPALSRPQIELPAPSGDHPRCSARQTVTPAVGGARVGCHP